MRTPSCVGDSASASSALATSRASIDFTLSAFEQQAMAGMLDTLKNDIVLGEEFVNK